MKFIKYPSIINSFKGDMIDYIKMNHADDLKDVTWYVTEKIHGANFSIWTDGKEVQWAKRNGFIQPKESFYDYNVIRVRYIANIAMLQKLVNKPIVLYGELFGEGVQKEVWYTTGKEFAGFDIAVIKEDDTLEFLPEAEVHDLMFAAGIHMPPLLKECETLEEAFAVSNIFDSFISGKTNNTAEGVVIKPSKTLFTTEGERIIFKNKNEKFKESKSVNVPSVMNGDFVVFFNELKTHITAQRFANVVSKIGREAQATEYFKAFLTDCLDQIKEIKYNEFTDFQKKFLNKVVGRYLWPIIKDELYKKPALEQSVMSGI